MMIKMLNDNPNVTIELGAHTDGKGSDQYNERGTTPCPVGGLPDCRSVSTKNVLKPKAKSVPKVINKKMAKSFDFLKEGDVLTEEFILTLLRNNRKWQTR